MEHENNERDAPGRDDVQDVRGAADARMPLQHGGTVHARVLARRRELRRSVRAVGDGGLSAAAAFTQRRTIPSHCWLRNQLQEHRYQHHRRPAAVVSAFCARVGVGREFYSVNCEH